MNRQYVVSEELLNFARQIMNENPHKPNCSIHDFWGGPDSDYCNCGHPTLIRKYIAECKKIKEILPEEELHKLYKNTCATRLVSFEEFKKNYYGFVM